MAERDEIQLAADAVVFQAQKKIGTLNEQIQMLKDQVAHLTEERDGVQRANNDNCRTLIRMQEILKTYVDRFGGLHKDGCRKNDSCRCWLVKETNELCAMPTF